MRQIEVSYKDGRWHVVLIPRDPENGSQVLVSYRLKVAAMIAARAVGLYAKTEVVEKGRNGQIQDRNSYGGDSPSRPG